MLEGFEIQTAPLTPYEKERILPLFLIGLNQKKGKEKAVTSTVIALSINRLIENDTNRPKRYKMNGVRVRKIVNYIRMKGLILGIVATSEGYYISTDVKEVEAWISSLKGREEAIKAIRKEAEKYLNQLSLKLF